MNRKQVAGLGGLCLLAGIFPLYIILRRYTEFNVSNRVRIVGIVVSSLLTLSLILVYIDMSDVQRTQSNILNLSHKPDLRIDALAGDYKEKKAF